MNALKQMILAAAIAASLGACSPGQHGAPASTNGTAAAEPGVIDRQLEEAREKLRSESVTVGGEGSLPRAEISPRGELIIGGKPVPLDPNQTRLALEYREKVLEIASNGIDIGKQGADLAMAAVTEAVRGVFTGAPDEIGPRVEAKAQGVKDAALRLCDRMPAMREAQVRLAEAVPQFAPYARMTAEDIAQCRRDILEENGEAAGTGTGTPPAATSAEAAAGA